MREDDSNWFSNWEHELPSPDELVPLSQTLISPDLAIAFGIKLIPDSQNPNPPLFPSAAHTTTPNSAESDSPEPAPAAAGDDYARAVKRPRLVWTPQLHKRFVDAVAQLGIKNAVPKTIMQLMSVDGLTRENVASHLQKYRLYLKRMQGGSSGAGWLSSSGDPATDHLFSTSPVPALFLQQQNRDNILPFSPPPQHHQQLQQPHYRQVGKYGSGLNGHLDHSFLMGQSQPGHRIRSPVYNSGSVGYNGEEEEAGDAENGRRVLTLFPTGGDD